MGFEFPVVLSGASRGGSDLKFQTATPKIEPHDKDLKVSVNTKEEVSKGKYRGNKVRKSKGRIMKEIKEESDLSFQTLTPTQSTVNTKKEAKEKNRRNKVRKSKGKIMKEIKEDGKYGK